MAFSESRWSGLPGDSSEEVPTIDLVLPEEIDTAWRDMFMEAYGNSGMRTIVDTKFCLRQKLSPNCLLTNEPMSYQTINLEELSGTDQNMVEGVVVGVQMIARLSPDDGETEYDPYLVLPDAEVLTVPVPMTWHPDQRLLVPIDGLEGLSLYP